MKLKSLALCVALLAIASFVVYLNSRPAPPPAADPRVGQPLVDTTTASATTHVHLSDSGKTVELGRDAAGNWVVQSYYDLPIDFTKLSQFMNDLVAAKVDRFVTASPERLARLGFGDSKIEFRDKDGKSLWAITVGKTPDSGTGHFFEFGTEAKAFLTGFSDPVDSDAKAWADAQLTSIKDGDVAKVELTLLDGSTTTLTRAKAGDPWSLASGKAPKDRALSQDKIAGVLASAGNIRFSDTVDLGDAAIAAAKNRESVALTTFAGKTVAITLSRKAEEKKLKVPVADKNSGPASLGKLSDVANEKSGQAKPEDKKPGAPEFETIPAGPVFVAVRASDPTDRVNGEMAKRAFQTDESIFISVPVKADDLFDPPPAPPAAPTPAPAAAEKIKE